MSEMIDVYKSSHPMRCTSLWGHRHAVINWRFFNLQKGKVFYTVDNEVSALKLLAFYENLLIGQDVSVRCPY